jgi:hypothetical protein
VDDRSGSVGHHLQVDFAVVLHEPGREASSSTTGVLGVFPEHTWLHLLEGAGFSAQAIPARPDDDDGPQPMFLGLRPA